VGRDADVVRAHLLELSEVILAGSTVKVADFHTIDFVHDVLIHVLETLTTPFGTCTGGTVQSSSLRPRRTKPNQHC
jgi:hypothetical protein